MEHMKLRLQVVVGTLVALSVGACVGFMLTDLVSAAALNSRIVVLDATISMIILGIAVLIILSVLCNILKNEDD